MELRRVDLLVLRSKKHGCNSNQLKLGSTHLVVLQVSVNDVDGQVQGLGHHFKLEMNLDQPVNKDATHSLIDEVLLRHVVGVDLKLLFRRPEEVVHSIDVLGAEELVVSIADIDVVSLTLHVHTVIGHGDRLHGLNDNLIDCCGL